MNVKTKKVILLFTLFIIIFINNKRAFCTELTENNDTTSTITGGVFTDGNGLVYEEVINASGINEYKVVSYTGDGRDVIIPDEYNGGAVTSVADNAFYDNRIIRSVILGSNITEIGSGAFAFCTSMYQIVIPVQVTKFGENAFYGFNKDRFTIVTPEDSKAWKFALKNGILFTDTKKTHLSDKKSIDIEGSQNRIYVYSAPSKVKWKSMDNKIARVNKNGKITALKAGSTTVIAETAGQALKCKVKVLKRNKKNCLKVIYSKYVKKEMTDYEKIYAAHAWLVQNVKYDKTLYKTGTVPAVSHTAKGAFNRGIAVCDGYSKAFIIIMEHYGIKCRMVTGGYHAWNMVKIKNKWYHIDCTYDDPVVNGSFNNKIVFMDFFLKTDKEMRKTHVWDYSSFPKCNSKKINKNYRTV